MLQVLLKGNQPVSVGLLECIVHLHISYRAQTHSKVSPVHIEVRPRVSTRKCQLCNAKCKTLFLQLPPLTCSSPFLLFSTTCCCFSFFFCDLCMKSFEHWRWFLCDVFGVDVDFFLLLLLTGSGSIGVLCRPFHLRALLCALSFSPALFLWPLLRDLYDISVFCLPLHSDWLWFISVVCTVLSCVLSRLALRTETRVLC